jgi:hypothetical protein
LVQEAVMRMLAVSAGHRLALGIVLVLAAAPAWGQDGPAQRATLRGVAVVEVVVEAMDPVAERDGLTRSRLLADVEPRLRQAGIPVGSTLTGHLYVNVDTVKSGDGQTYAYNISIQYMQQVVLARDPKAPVFATTWETGGVGMIGTQRLPEVRREVLTYVDQFIDAYREQNPKP